jgi:hypothetical protein
MKKLDKEEKNILESFEKGEWVSESLSAAQKTKYQKMAREALKKEQEG